MGQQGISSLTRTTPPLLTRGLNTCGEANKETNCSHACERANKQKDKGNINFFQRGLKPRPLENQSFDIMLGNHLNLKD